MNHDNDFEEDDYEIKSRTQIKKEMQALQDLGKKLTQLKASQLKSIPISESLDEAITLYNNIHKKEGKRRQLQFIGKLMRDEDAEAIQAALDVFDTASVAYAQTLHELEAWRDRMTKDDKDALTDFVNAYPGTDVQHLRQLIRNAKKDISNNKNTGASKKLFQFLRQSTSELD